MLVKSRGFFNAIRSKANRRPVYINMGPYLVLERKRGWQTIKSNCEIPQRLRISKTSIFDTKGHGVQKLCHRAFDIEHLQNDEVEETLEKIAGVRW